MIDFELLRDRGVLVVSPDGPLKVTDFEQLARSARSRSPAGKASERLCLTSSLSPIIIGRLNALPP